VRNNEWSLAAHELSYAWLNQHLEFLSAAGLGRTRSSSRERKNVSMRIYT
jgi:hypothetical protein